MILTKKKEKKLHYVQYNFIITMCKKLTFKIKKKKEEEEKK